jgi:hypothetical protein
MDLTQRTGSDNGSPDSRKYQHCRRARAPTPPHPLPTALHWASSIASWSSPRSVSPSLSWSSPSSLVIIVVVVWQTAMPCRRNVLGTYPDGMDGRRFNQSSRGSSSRHHTNYNAKDEVDKRGGAPPRNALCAHILTTLSGSSRTNFGILPLAASSPPALDGDARRETAGRRQSHRRKHPLRPCSTWISTPASSWVFLRPLNPTPHSCSAVRGGSTFFVRRGCGTRGLAASPPSCVHDE